MHVPHADPLAAFLADDLARYRARYGVARQRLIVSRYAGRCAVCRGVYAVGDVVAWASGEGARHQACATGAQPRKAG